MADIQGNYRVTYLDGREETTTVSVGNRIQAEIQARRGKWGNLQESAYRQLSYSVWHSLKRDHKTELEFNDWTFTVDDIEKTGTDEEPETFTGEHSGSPAGSREA